MTVVILYLRESELLLSLENSRKRRSQGGYVEAEAGADIRAITEADPRAEAQANLNARVNYDLRAIAGANAKAQAEANVRLMRDRYQNNNGRSKRLILLKKLKE